MFRVPLLLLVGCLILSGLSGTALADWKTQWRYVSEAAIKEVEENLERATTLRQDAQRLATEAQQRYNQSLKSTHNEAARYYRQAALEFENAIREYNAALTEFRNILSQSQHELSSSEISGTRQMLIRVHKMAQQTARSATHAFNQGVGEFNRGAQHFQGSVVNGSQAMKDHAQQQAQTYEFQVKRMTALTKLALIKVRDQRKFFKLPGCEADLSKRYKAVLTLLGDADLTFRDAAGHPADIEAKIDEGNALLAKAKGISDGILDRYDTCLKGK